VSGLREKQNEVQWCSEFMSAVHLP